MKILSNPAEVANFFLEKAKEENISDITQLKLIKLVYLAHGWSLWGFDDSTLLEPDSFQAWKHGPVLPVLYHEFKHYGNSPINDFSTEIEMQGKVDIKKKELPEFKIITPRIDFNNEPLVNLLEFVWGTYKDYSGWALRELTHQKSTPWKSVYKEGKKDVLIPDSSIKEHFKAKAKEYGLDG